MSQVEADRCMSFGRGGMTITCQDYHEGDGSNHLLFSI